MENKILFEEEINCDIKKDNIAIFDVEELLLNKIYGQLKYCKVFGITDNKINNEFYNINFLDIDKLLYFLKSNLISTVIISSEIFNKVDYNPELFIKFISTLDGLGIKVILVSVKNPIIIEDGASIGGIDRKYDKFINRLEKKVSKGESNLIIKCSTYYGYSRVKKDFIRWIVENDCKNKIELDNSAKLNPILIDDISGYIEKNVNSKKGTQYLVTNSCCTLYEFAKKICNIFKKDKNYIGKNSKMVLVNNDFINCNKEVEEIKELDKGINIVKRQIQCSFEVIYKTNPMLKKNNVSIAKYRLDLGKRLKKSIPNEVINKIDYVVPVPATGIYYALGLAEETKITYMQLLNKVSGDIRSFPITDVDKRRDILKSNIIPIKELIKGKVLAIVDEAIFTGITLKVVCSMLKECGAKEIYLCIPTPALCSNCKYNVHPHRNMLKEKLSEEDLKSYFQVEGVYFQRKDEFYEGLLPMGENCTECFTKCE